MLQKKENKDYSKMTWGEMTADPQIGSMLDKKVIEYLKIHDPGYWNRHFEGKLSTDDLASGRILISVQHGKKLRPCEMIESFITRSRIMKIVRDDLSH
jgi:hypothetical protein